MLRLHSTYRHDLKCYSSDEGRCQKTAAAFLKGLLDLDGALPPILAVMVKLDEDVQEMLNDSQNLQDGLLQKVKEQIQDLFHTDKPIYEKFKEMFKEEPTVNLGRFLKEINEPMPKMKEIYEIVKLITAQLKEREDIDIIQTTTYLLTNHEFEETFKKDRPIEDQVAFERKSQMYQEMRLKSFSKENLLEQNLEQEEKMSIKLKQLGEKCEIESALMQFKRWKKIEEDLVIKSEG